MTQVSSECEEYDVRLWSVVLKLPLISSSCHALNVLRNGCSCSLVADEGKSCMHVNGIVIGEFSTI